MGVQFDIKVNSTGVSEVDRLNDKLVTAGGNTNKLTSALNNIGSAAFAINNIQQALQGIGNDFMAAVQPGIGFNTSLTELSSITGVTGDALDSIGEKARQNAIKFGTDAAGSVDSYTLLLSQLSPELAKNESALASMGETASILSKQLKGDTAGATEILTTAMNQYGVSLEDPMAASEQMASMMNVMSAAAKEGSATLPSIQAALSQSGLMAKTANVSFEELNAAIQVLDKAGKKGAEGGVAIRNVLAEIGQGSRMPRIAATALEQYGISTDALADKSLTMSQRLALLKPMMGDSSAMTAVFGKENVAAAMAMVQSTDEMDRLTGAVTDTTAGVEIADTVMGGWQEKLNRTNAWFKDLGISLFNMTDGFIPFLQMAGSGLMMMTNLGGAVQAFSILGNTSFIKTIATMLTGMGTWIGSTITATAAQWGLNIALNANPIGLVVLAVAAAVAAIALLITYWDEIKAAVWKFTQFMWEISPFKFLIDVVENIFPGFKKSMGELWDFIKDKFDILTGWIGELWADITGFFGSDAIGGEEPAIKTISGGVLYLPPDTQVDDKKKPKGTGTGTNRKAGRDAANNIAGGGNRNTVITLNIGKLQDQIVVHTTNLRMGAQEAGDQLVEGLLTALNGANAALQGVS